MQTIQTTRNSIQIQLGKSSYEFNFKNNFKQILNASGIFFVDGILNASLRTLDNQS